MKPFLVERVLRIKGKVVLPGDKSIAHRCIIISALSQGKTIIKNFPLNRDCLYTVNAFKKLGIKIKPGQLKTFEESSDITVFGGGLYGLNKPKTPIFVGDSGTTLRILLGVLAGQDFAVRLTAGKSLINRPMLRVTQPLRMMGASIDARRKTPDTKHEEYPPITIRGGNLKSITYNMPVASAQVKSAILLAGLYAKGFTRVIEPIKTRDHTERILKLFKARIKVKQNNIVIKGNSDLVSPGKIYVPGDISSASFFIVMASILPNSKVLIKNVGLNPTRVGIIRVLKRMGAQIKVSKCQSAKVSNSEPMGDLIVKSSFLRGTKVMKEEIPSLIDELPVLMVAAAVASGKTVFEGVNELRVKETDRVKSMIKNLNKMGAEIKVFKVANSEHIVIKGVRSLRGARVSSFGDHRTAMSMVVAGLKAKGKTLIDDIVCANKSFPHFTHLLKTLIQPCCAKGLSGMSGRVLMKADKIR